MSDPKSINPGGAMLTLDADRLRQLAEALMFDDETGAEYDEDASDWADPSTWTGLAHDEKHDAALARYLAAVRPSIVLELLAALDAAKHRLLELEGINRPVYSTREAMREAGVEGWQPGSGVSSADAIRQLAAERDAAWAEGAATVANELGWDGDGDPVEHARVRWQELQQADEDVARVEVERDKARREMCELEALAQDGDWDGPSVKAKAEQRGWAYLYTKDDDQ